MTISEFALAAAYERKHFACLPGDNGRRVTWVMAAFGQLKRWNGRDWVPFAPSLFEAFTEQWRLSDRGPSTARPLRKK